MKLSDLRPAPGSHKTERRLGRGHGSGRGKTAGRGTKGQLARTGGKVNRSFNGGQTRLSKRLPFVRGWNNGSDFFRDDYTIINIADISEIEAGSELHPKDMVAQGLMTVARSKGLIKLLGDGEIDRALTVHVHKASASARTKIEAAGGRIELIPVKTHDKTKRRKDEDKTATTAQQAD